VFKKNIYEEPILRLTGYSRNITYYIKVFAINVDFLGEEINNNSEILIKVVEQANNDNTNINVLYDLNQFLYNTYGDNNLDKIAGGQANISFDLNDFYENFDHFYVGVFDEIPNNYQSLANNSFTQKYDVKINGSVVNFNLNFRNKLYYCIIRISNSTNTIHNVIAISESIRPPIIIQPLSIANVPLLTNQLYSLNLTDYFSGPDLTYNISVQLNENIDNPIIYSDADVSIQENNLLIQANYRNNEYFVKVVAQNVDYLGQVNMTSETFLRIREDADYDRYLNDLSTQTTNNTEPLIFVLNSLYRTLPIDFSYKILDSNLTEVFETNTDVEIIYENSIWNLVISPNYRNKLYYVQIIASYPTSSNLDNDRSVIIPVSESIKPPTKLNDIEVFVFGNEVVNLSYYHTGPNLQYRITSIYEINSNNEKINLSNNNVDVTLQANILTINTTNNVVKKYYVDVDVFNTDYLGNENIITTTINVFEPNLNNIVEGGEDNGLADLEILNGGFEVIPTPVCLDDNQMIYKQNLSEIFTGSLHSYSFTITDNNNNILSNNDYDVYILKDYNNQNILYIQGSYKDMYYNINVTAKSVVDETVMVTSTLRIVETVKSPYIINGGLEKHTVLLLRNNQVQFDLTNIFTPSFQYKDNALEVKNMNNEPLLSSEHDVVLDKINNILYINGNYRNNNYIVKVTVVRYNSDMTYSYSVSSTLEVVEHIKPISFK